MRRRQGNGGDGRKGKMGCEMRGESIQRVSKKPSLPLLSQKKKPKKTNTTKSNKEDQRFKRREKGVEKGKKQTAWFGTNHKSKNSNMLKKKS